MDLTVLKTKQERIDALQRMPNFVDITSNFPRKSRQPVQEAHILKGFHSLSAEDDLECYMSTFERLCTSQSIVHTRWPILLEPFLTGKAQQAFYVLCEAQKENYTTVKSSYPCCI